MYSPLSILLNICATIRHLTGQREMDCKERKSGPGRRRIVDSALLNIRHFADEPALRWRINPFRCNGLRMGSAMHLRMLPESGNRDSGNDWDRSGDKQ
jgi:hypothetical protein